MGTCFSFSFFLFRGWFGKVVPNIHTLGYVPFLHSRWFLVLLGGYSLRPLAAGPWKYSTIGDLSSEFVGSRLPDYTGIADCWIPEVAGGFPSLLFVSSLGFVETCLVSGVVCCSGGYISRGMSLARIQTRHLLS